MASDRPLTPSDRPLTPQAKVTIAAPQTRTPEQMRQDANRRPPAPEPGTDPDAPASRFGFMRARTEGRYLKPFLPMMNMEEYKNEKGRARQHAPLAKPAPATLAPDDDVTAERLAPAGVLTFIEGATNVDAGAPPDTHGAIGPNEFVEVTNSHVDIFPRSTPASRTSISQAAFFGYFTRGLFDARVIHDAVADRWVIMSEAFPESPTVQNMFVAVSTGPSALGSFLIYTINVTFNAGDFWDYPQVGLDQAAIIFTANVFDSSSNPRGADMFAVPKAQLYSGLGFSVPLFTGLVGTLAPTIVLDANPNTYLLAAPPSGSSLQLYTLINSGNPATLSLIGPTAVPVPAYNVPPPSPQPGLSNPADNLDTGDSRFVNASTQVGDSLWNVHTIALAGFAAPKFYEVKPSTATVAQSAFFYASLTSFDFNSSIAANASNDVFVTWSAVDPPAGVNAEIRVAGSVGVGGAGFNPGSGVVLVGSAAGITGDFDPRFGLQRWGDYSAVTIDPTNPAQAWVVNEKINGAADWGSGIGAIG